MGKFLFLILLCQTFCFSGYAEGYTENTNPPFTELDPYLGWIPKANSQSHWQKYLGSELISESNFSFDAYRRRSTLRKANAKQFLLFFGDSNTFGEGLEFGQTLPSYVSKFSHASQGYNYAFRGFGPNHFYMQISKQNFHKQVKERKGMAIYVYLDFHVNRLLGASNTISYSEDAPYLQLENKQIHYLGSFREKRKWTNFIYKLIDNSFLATKYYYFMPRIKNSDYDFLCKIFSDTKEYFSKQNIQFLILLHPQVPAANYLVQCLQKNSIAFLDYRNIFSGIPFNKVAQKDRHITAFGNEIIAKRLVKDLHL